MIIMSLPHVTGYDIVEKIGVGSFSAVYKAYAKVLDKTCEISQNNFHDFRGRPRH